MVLIGRIEQCIFPVHIVLRHRLEFILKEKFQCTKTGSQRCAMQISIAIKGALSSVRAHSFVKLMKERKSEKADEKKLNKRRQKCTVCFSYYVEMRAFLKFEISNPKMRRRVLTKSMFLLWRFLPDSLYFN
ncbi:conserved hypothetical protein [Trichinella spiralis]|uniref:hypothetical protein n=1 Tax=Trichinella spiralis TaxID=6334 RepID=UPI0001EFBF17|nr:conserved hypothetical protein [Trichinella spiralis]